MNVGQDTTLCNGDMTEKLVQFFIVADGKLEMTRDDTGLLVVTSGIASKFEDFSREVLENGSEINGSTSTDTLGIVTLSQETVNTTNRECETRLGGSAVTEISIDSDSQYGRQMALQPQPPWEQHANVAHPSGFSGQDLRLSALGARGLAARFAASHFECEVGFER